jgi:hypothetical protein
MFSKNKCDYDVINVILERDISPFYHFSMIIIMNIKIKYDIDDIVT